MSSLQLLLGLVSTVILGFESHRTIFIVSNLKLPEPGRPGLRIYFPKEQGGPVLPTTYVSITTAIHTSQFKTWDITGKYQINNVIMHAN
jgi:hypothetical protein